MNDEEMLTRALKALAEDMEPLSAPGTVELKLLEAFHKQKVVTPIVPKRSRASYWIAAAIAAMLLIAVSVVAFRLNRRVDDRNVARQDQPQGAPKNNDVSPVVPQEVAGVEAPLPPAPTASSSARDPAAAWAWLA